MIFEEKDKFRKELLIVVLPVLIAEVGQGIRDYLHHRREEAREKWEKKIQDAKDGK